MTYRISAILCSTLILSACQQGGTVEGNRNTYQGAAIGAAAGAVIGAISGDHDSWKRAGIGAGVGALAGGGIGAYMDDQEQSMRHSLQGTGIGIQRYGNELQLSVPESITFGFDRSDLQPQGRDALNSMAGVLRQYPQSMLEITGHTDSVGSDAYNLKLSQRRAQSVGSYLTSQGVQQRIITTSVGESSPIADNTTEYGRAQNRRVEIRISPISG